jgi:hypothetical protein
MPELTYAPPNPVWPPPGRLDPRVTRHILRSSSESLGGIADHYGIAFEDLIEFNYSLTKPDRRYFEKINWYLKHKLKCKNTTAGGNFIFTGGEIIYIPPRGQTFDDQPVTATPKEGRLSRLVYTDTNEVEPRDPEAPHP